jgi:hypothetical protein
VAERRLVTRVVGERIVERAQASPGGGGRRRCAVGGSLPERDEHAAELMGAGRDVPRRRDDRPASGRGVRGDGDLVRRAEARFGDARDAASQIDDGRRAGGEHDRRCGT